MNIKTWSNIKQKGLTLIELMISMVIGLILLTGVLQIAITNNDSYRMHEALSRVQESGRFAMDLLSRDVRMADFWGCARGIGNVTNNLNPVGAGYVNYTYASGLSGTDGTPDTITLSGAFGSGINVETPYMNNSSSMIHVPANNGLEQFDIILLSDCLQGDIFEITGSNPSGSGSVVHNTGVVAIGPGNYNPSATCASGHCLSKTYDGEAQIYKVQSVTYSTSVSAFSEPVLTRSVNGGAAMEVVTGVENMQFTYGEDTTGDGVVDIYRTATNVVDWDEVINVKVSILLRSPDPVINMSQTYQYEGVTYTVSDRRLRRVFTSIITLRNRTK